MSNTNERTELIAALRLLAQISGGKLVTQAADMLESNAPHRDKQWHDTAWQRGFQMGVSGAAKVVKDATDALADEQKAHKETNRMMTEALMQAEVQQAAVPEVQWGVDWGTHGDRSCVSILKKYPNGGIEVVATEYEPQKGVKL